VAIGAARLTKADAGRGFFSWKAAAMSERDWLAHGHDDLVRKSRSDGGGIWAASSVGKRTVCRAPWSNIALISCGKPAWRHQRRIRPDSGLRSSLSRCSRP